MIALDVAERPSIPNDAAWHPGNLVTPPPAKVVPAPEAAPRVAEYDALNLPLICLAENLTDIESARISMANRHRQLAELDAGQADIRRLAALIEGLEQLEHVAVLDLQRAMRAHPLGPWVKRSKGVGEKQAARLLASIGNPYWNSLHQRPRRGPAELWAYCGYHVISPDGQSGAAAHPRHAVGGPLLPVDPKRSDVRSRCVDGQSSATPTDPARPSTPGEHVGGVAPKRRKGQRSNWNSTARTRAYLVAESCMKSREGTYRPDYDKGRSKYSGLPDGHAHNRALRLVAKAVLRDIFLEAKKWHEAAS